MGSSGRDQVEPMFLGVELIDVHAGVKGRSVFIGCPAIPFERFDISVCSKTEVDGRPRDRVDDVVGLVLGVRPAKDVLHVSLGWVAVNRQRQIYEASIMHAIGTRMNVVMRSVIIEYALLAVVLSVFAMLAGGAIAQTILALWLKLSADGVAWAGAVVASGASVLCLLAGAAWIVSNLKISPAVLLKRGGA